ncbi:protein CURVATURE THYLAKOID 1B, chloroplastic [Impatiens glandulifera]|uniref:protein CURVATURE THYLAKOID 1B, chloroplastic n=1 Tax=Impatiens glandulifera TaxID=253017 RepID=UPI001FB11BB2|nr:protein CURVATURE THYLAKOID 1B, chloroplastic [Impatiens glandulifera]
MAASTTSSTPLSLSSSSSSTLRQSSALPSSQCMTLPTLSPPVPSLSRPSYRNAAAYCRKIARNVVSMATGDAPAEIGVAETPEILKTVQEAWDKVEDKYAVSSLAVAAVVGLIGASGLIGAIDKLPLIPGALEVVGIGYTGWFTYRNLVFKPDREALLQKIKDTYKDIIGS